MSGVVYFDMPYGLAHESWDAAVWSEDITATFLCEATVLYQCCWFACGHLGSSGTNTTCSLGSEETGFSDFEDIIWIKPNQTIVGMPERITPAHEICIIAYSHAMDSKRVRRHKNPTKRLNFLTAPSVRTTTKRPNSGDPIDAR